MTARHDPWWQRLTTKPSQNRGVAVCDVIYVDDVVGTGRVELHVQGLESQDCYLKDVELDCGYIDTQRQFDLGLHIIIIYVECIISLNVLIEPSANKP